MRRSVVTALLALLSAAAIAQEAEQSLSKKLANPLAAMISVPTQVNYDDDLGVNGDGKMLQINIQPVIPFQLNDTWNLITRTIIPIIEQKDLTPSSGSDSGMGDILESAFFSPIQPTERGWIWGVGPVLLLPTATDDDLGADQWAMGPTFVTLKQQGPWTTGLLVNHLWTTGGEDDIDKDNAETLFRMAAQRGISLSTSDSINASYVEPWISFAASHGTTYSLSTESSYDWDGSSWLVPVVVTADHLFENAPIPFSFGVAARYWAESPDGGPENFSARVQFTFLLSK